jgi:DNA polymerase-1
MQISDPDNTLVLVDGSSYIYRAWHALPNLTSPKGEATGAIYGVISMIRKILDEWKPKRMAVIFDAPGRTFRDEWYDQYKANRPPMPDDLKQQITSIHQMVAALGIPVLSIPGVEADDVIGTLCHQATQQEMQVWVSTGDKDMAQLVNQHITLINTMTNECLDREGVLSKFGIPPERIVDFLALTGDTSDNVPGIEKVGPKTAVKWLKEWGTLENLVAHADQVGGKVGENLRAGLPQLGLSRKLVTIRLDLGEAEGLTVSPQSLVLAEPDQEALEAYYRRFDFKRWLKSASVGVSGAAPVSQGDSSSGRSGRTEKSTAMQSASEEQAILVTDRSLFESWLHKLEQATCFAFDTETTSLNPMQAKLVGISFALTDNEAIYVPVGHAHTEAGEQLSLEWVLEKIRPVMENPRIAKIGHNLKYDLHILANYGLHVAGGLQDSMLQSYVLDSTASRHDMDSLAAAHLEYKTITYQEVTGSSTGKVGFEEVALIPAAAYAAEDARVTLSLFEHFQQKLNVAPVLEAVYSSLEVPLIPVLLRMERNGVRVDSEMLGKQSREIEQRLVQVEQAAHAEAGEEFNLGSPVQLQKILFEKMKMRVVEKTPKGAPSTSESVLQELALDYTLPAIILEHRSLSKLKSTYTDKLPLQVNAQTGRIHTSYHQAVTATGRLSSSDPNLQNIPVRTEEGRRVRQAFVASPGSVLAALDYSQIELRIMAHLSKDEGLRKAFAEDQDIHRFTASEVFGSPLDKVSNEQRRAAKAINFGLIYGMSAFGLARQLSIPRAAAQEYINLYFARYPGVRVYMDETIALAKERGYVETLFGRRLYLPEIQSRNGRRRQYAERTAINAPMQGTAADIIKKAMIDMDQRLQEHWDAEVKMIMQVHDELVFEVPLKWVEDFVPSAKKIMESAAELAVPLRVDAGVGLNWDEAH